METTKEQKERLIREFSMVIDAEVLNELEILAILQICSDACEREKVELYEKMLTESIESGVDPNGN